MFFLLLLHLAHGHRNHSSGPGLVLLILFPTTALECLRDCLRATSQDAASETGCQAPHSRTLQNLYLHLFLSDSLLPLLPGKHPRVRRRWVGHPSVLKSSTFLTYSVYKLRFILIPGVSDFGKPEPGEDPHSPHTCFFSSFSQRAQKSQGSKFKMGTLNPLVGCPGGPQADQPEGRTKLNSIGKNSWLIGCASCWRGRTTSLSPGGHALRSSWVTKFTWRKQRSRWLAEF